jgi:hypothetical protein
MVATRPRRRGERASGARQRLGSCQGQSNAGIAGQDRCCSGCGRGRSTDFAEWDEVTTSRRMRSASAAVEIAQGRKTRQEVASLSPLRADWSHQGLLDAGTLNKDAFWCSQLTFRMSVWYLKSDPRSRRRRRTAGIDARSTQGRRAQRPLRASTMVPRKSRKTSGARGQTGPDPWWAGASFQRGKAPVWICRLKKFGLANLLAVIRTCITASEVQPKAF